VRRYSRRTEAAYRHWVKRFIFFHRLRHPDTMSTAEVNAFLTHLAVREGVSASTQNQALSAILFLYRHVLGRELVVLTRDEVSKVLGLLDGTTWIVASLLYGSGLRLLECLRLRVEDVGSPQEEAGTRQTVPRRAPARGHGGRDTAGARCARGPDATNAPLVPDLQEGSPRSA
jgi:site-specific recombinase XerD